MAAIVGLAGTTLSPGSAAFDATMASQRAHWVVDPASAGDDLPSRGRSLFDFLVTQEDAGHRVQAVPFPFSELLQRVGSRTARNARSAAPTAVLIPLGRSLQRTSAAPEFFAFPRAVVAVVAEPDGSGNPYLRDRVYLGYQEKANVIEVISYNEDEGRFEFQVVTDYRRGGTPKIAYANRTLCVACHQNAAPIFSRAVWDETNANPGVAWLLRKERQQFYGVPVDRGIDVPNAIDDAKLRANRFAVHQLLWKEGCGGSDAPAVACRAGLFAAMLRYRLTGQTSFDPTDAPYRERVIAPLLAGARRQWPGGLAIGNPDIPNRNPLPVSETIGSAELVSVAAAFDPLLPRPPLEVWRVDDDDDVARLVAGLAEFLAESDVERLDDALLMQAEAKRIARRTYRASCKFESAAVDRDRQRIEFGCTAGPASPDAGLALAGRLFVAGSRLVGGAIDRVAIEGLPPTRDLDLEVRGSGARMAVVTPMRGRLRARSADGNAFDRIELRWGDREGAATLVALDDYGSAKSAIDDLASENLARKFDGFDALAFRRARLMPALLSRLGAKPGAWCCVDASGMPPPRAARAEIPDLPLGESFKSTTAASHAAFQRYCAECHRGADRAPPNFLLGDTDEVEAKLKHCAPRIYYRLSMWQRTADARPKTPMPPEIALRHFNLADATWRDGGALSGLLLSISEKLQADGGEKAGDSLLLQSYESLRACLPAGSTATLPQPSPRAPDPKQARRTATLDR